MKGFIFLCNQETKKYKNKRKKFKLVIGLIQSIDTVLVLGVTSSCVTLTITGVVLVVVPITSGVGEIVCIFS